MFSKGKFVVILRNSSYCIINRAGKIIKTAKPGQIYKVKSDQLFIEENARYYFTDKKFDKISNMEFSDVYEIYNNPSSFVVNKMGGYGITDKQGKGIIPPIYKYTTFSENQDRYINSSEFQFYGSKKGLIINLKNLKVVREISFKSKYFGTYFQDGFYYTGTPQVVLEEMTGRNKISNFNIIIDQYGNVAKITY